MDNINSAFIEIANAVSDVILEIRYYSTFNFVGERIDGYVEPTALLTKEAADALKAAADELKGKGYRLKIYDAYRPQRAVDHFV
jgi:D-alanyl-D-alanine dipeptidase